MIDGEELFVALNLLPGLDPEQTKEMIEQGYLTKGIPGHTPKANAFISDFIEKYKMPLYKAMKQSNNEYWEAIKIVGLNNYITFDVLANQMEEEGLLSKDKYGDFKAVNYNKQIDHKERK